MRISTVLFLGLTCGLCALIPLAQAESTAEDSGLPTRETINEKDYTPIFDGKTLDGWEISAKSGHSSPSKHKSGGKWVVKDGAIIGSQDIPGNGGLVITKKKYKNFDVVLEMNNDDGPDSGLFLRSSADGKCYQAMIDYHKGGNLMGIYGEGIGGVPHVRNFNFTTDVSNIEVADYKPFPSPISAKQWKKFWKPGKWMELRARIEGNPPHITTWIQGVKFMDFTDNKKRLPDDGGIALQVHGGGNYTKQFVRYRNIRVKELE